jgi:hypothetical protein
MSHFTRVKTQIKNKKCLVKALEDLGFKNSVEVHDTPQNLYGYQNDKREQTAEIILRRKHVGGASNDIGFVLREDGTYEAIISDYDQHNSASRKNDLTMKTNGYGKEWQSLLNQIYAKHVVEDSAQTHGYHVTEQEVDEDGNIYLYVESPY